MANIEMSNYEVNKQMYNNKMSLNDFDLENKLEEVGNWFYDKEYIMLLCRERNDYTILNFKYNQNYMDAAKIDLPQCFRGLVLDIYKDDNSEDWEIWQRIDNENYCYRLFDCRDFIIEVGID